MSIIYKYRIDPVHGCELPVGAAVLHVGEQHGELYMWAAVDASAVGDDKNLYRAFPTGVEIPRVDWTLDFCGTVQMQCGLVFHIIAVGEAHPAQEAKL